MKGKKTSLFFGVLISFMLVFVGNSEAQKKRKVPGVEKDKVYVGTSQPFSGPAAAWGIVAKAMETYFQYVNEKKGGVHGRKIVLLARDDGYQPARMRANIEELHSKVLLFAAPLGTANVSANKDLIAEKKVPTIAPLGNVRMWVGYPWEKLKYFFVAYTDYLLEAKEITNFAIEKLGSEKIAIFYQNDDYGEAGLKGVEEVAKDKLVAKVSHELTEVDFSVHAQKIKDAGADTVIIYSNPRQSAAFVKKLSELGIKPKILASFPLADPVMVNLAGEAWDGAYVGGVIKLPQLYPESKQLFDEIVKLNPELAKTPFLTLYGIFVGALVEETLRRAGPEPTREKIIEVLENMENWESPVSFPITFGKKRRHGINVIGLWRVSKDGKYELVMEPKFLDPLF
jgi:ABC-type branched-subunit amino acid transport system substrate-binding protein